MVLSMLPYLLILTVFTGGMYLAIDTTAGERERQSLEPLLALAEADRERGLMDAPWPPVYPKMPGEPPRVAPSRARKPTD